MSTPRIEPEDWLLLAEDAMKSGIPYLCAYLTFGGPVEISSDVRKLMQDEIQRDIREQHPSSLTLGNILYSLASGGGYPEWDEIIEFHQTYLCFKAAMLEAEREEEAEIDDRSEWPPQREAEGEAEELLQSEARVNTEGGPHL